MTDAFPRWPPEWIEDHTLATDETIAQDGDVTFTGALRADDRVLLSVSWPEGRRYMLVDPIGTDPPQALRIGEVAEDPALARAIDRVWSQALLFAKKLMDGELGPAAMAGPPDPEPESGGGGGRRPWWRREG